MGAPITIRRIITINLFLLNDLLLECAGWWMPSSPRSPPFSSSSSLVRPRRTPMNHLFQPLPPPPPQPARLSSQSTTTVPAHFLHHRSLREWRRYATSAPLDEDYYSFMEAPLQTQSSSQAKVTLTRYLEEQVKTNPELTDMASLLLSVKMACKTISNLVNRAGLSSSSDAAKQQQQQQQQPNDPPEGGRYYSMKKLDKLSTLVLKNALKYTGKCEVTMPAIMNPIDAHHHHQPGVLIAKSIDSNYVACLDPLDGSGNADASICTGTIFGVFEETHNTTGAPLKNKMASIAAGRPIDKMGQMIESILQPGRNLRAAGYCLYSSATVLVFTFGDSVQGFTLDPQTQEFILSHPNLTIPPRGNVYSCNEANSEGWSSGFKTYLQRLKTGRGDTGQRYAHRYVGSMVGDIHRTLLYGGLFAYPADTLFHPQGNLQLLYKVAPMAFVMCTAGGKATDGGGDLLDARPERVHQTVPCFLGSPEDVLELVRFLATDWETTNDETI